VKGVALNEPTDSENTSGAGVDGAPGSQRPDVAQRLHTRFAIHDGVGLIAARLGQEELRWLETWFHSEIGCRGGHLLEIAAHLCQIQKSTSLVLKKQPSAGH